MAPIRVVIHHRGDPSSDAALLARTAATRSEAGCLEAQDFRSIENPDHLLHLELWESPVAWDQHWANLRSSADGRQQIETMRTLQAPFHAGHPENPRKVGNDAVEFYPQRVFTRQGPIWAASGDAVSPGSIRWPVGGAFRLVIQMTIAPDADLTPRLRNTEVTRAEVGCEEFEFFRSLEFPENIALTETWSSPETYDKHWLNSLRRQAALPGGPAPTPVERRYGAAGFEWYPHCFYTLVGDVWMPEDPARRMSTVIW